MMKITGKISNEDFLTSDATTHNHQGHLIPRIWFIVADHKMAHIYRKTADGLEKIGDAKEGMEDADSENSKFIPSLAHWLDTTDSQHKFDKLVLVADPHTLGHIRTSLTRKIHDKVTTELNKDLTKFSTTDIQKHLGDIMIL